MDSKSSKSLEVLNELRAKFYSADRFSSFYTEDYRLKQIKKALADKRTSAGERLQWLKYLDAHVGDVPEKGEGSGKTINEVLIKVEFVNANGDPVT